MRKFDYMPELDETICYAVYRSHFNATDRIEFVAERYA